MRQLYSQASRMINEKDFIYLSLIQHDLAGGGAYPYGNDSTARGLQFDFIILT